MWARWKSWSHEHRLATVGTYVTVASFVFAVFAYFFPHSEIPRPSDMKGSTAAEEIIIPVKIYNSLGVEALILQEAEFFILKPETPISDVTVDGGGVRLSRPDNITTINGRYPVPQNSSIKTKITLPRTKEITKYLNTGGYKLRLIVKNSWSNDYGGHGEIYFDKPALAQGINVRIEE